MPENYQGRNEQYGKKGVIRVDNCDPIGHVSRKLLGKVPEDAGKKRMSALRGVQAGGER
jgi:hypothetical protein